MISPNIPLCDLASLNWVSHRVPSSPAAEFLYNALSFRAEAVEIARLMPLETGVDTHTHFTNKSLRMGKASID